MRNIDAAYHCMPSSRRGSNDRQNDEGSLLRIAEVALSKRCHNILHGLSASLDKVTCECVTEPRTCCISYLAPIRRGRGVRASPWISYNCLGSGRESPCWQKFVQNCSIPLQDASLTSSVCEAQGISPSQRVATVSSLNSLESDVYN